MDGVWPQVEAAFLTVMMPMRAAMEAVGLEPSNIHVWALMVSIFMVALFAPTTYGDLVLRRRSRQAVGTVVSIDESDDTPTARIGFRDETGRQVEFDSDLWVNDRTSKVGGTTAVVYDPLNPKRAREGGRGLARLFTALAWYGFAVGIAIYAILGK